MALLLLFAPACQPPARLGASVSAQSPHQARRAAVATDEPQPALAYCVPHVPSIVDILFTVDFDGTDGSREPRFADGVSTDDLDPESNATLTRFSPSARALCQIPDKPKGRRYVLRVPINAEPRRLDEYVRFAARHGYDQPIFRINQALIAAQVENAEYGYSLVPSGDLPEVIGTATIEATADGDYTLRARTTDGREQSTPIGEVTLPAKPDMGDCESKLAESVRQLCAHAARPCNRVTLVGVNDIGPLLSVLGYVTSIAEVAAPAVSFQQREPGADSSPYLDITFRRNHRVRRFYAGMKPESDIRKVPLSESLARKKLGLYTAVPKDLAGPVTLADVIGKRLQKQEYAEVGKSRHCGQPGRTAVSLVVDSSDKVHLYAERIVLTEKSESLLRVYYDDEQRPRLVVNSEISEDGDAWDAYLVLGEDGCPSDERLATRNELPSNLLHWELKPLSDPRAAYSEPLCVDPSP